MASTIPTRPLRLPARWRVGILFLVVFLLAGAWRFRAQWQSRGRSARVPPSLPAAPSPDRPPSLRPAEAPGPSVGDSARKFADYRRGAADSALEKQTRTLAMSVANSIRGFYAEYEDFPLNRSRPQAEASPLRMDGVLTATLLATDSATNPKKIAFLPEVRPVGKGSGAGLHLEGETASIVDAWGEPFYVLFDADHSATIRNPNAAAAPAALHYGVIVWSAGPDKDPSTWDDNVTSWPTADSRRLPAPPSPDR